MPEPTNFIKISIRPPSPEWWSKVKEYARKRGMYVGALVVAAITEYIVLHRGDNQYPHIAKEL